MIIDMSKCPYSFRHGKYGGQAGEKDGIIYHDENWIVKYPKSTRSFTGTGFDAYTTAPLSEYIGSHIYEILGLDTHKTELCFRNGKIAVACKDFQKHFGDLAEFRTIKNAANAELSKYMDKELPLSATGDSVILEETLLHLKENPLILAVKNQVEQRFWQCVIIDILIDNNDRNNGNWGLLIEDNGMINLAPIYDNGNAFSNKASEEKIKEYLLEKNNNRILGGRTAYMYEGQIQSAKKMLRFNNTILKREIISLTKKIHEKIPEIMMFIDNIPERYHNILVCSPERKDYYKKCLQIRFQELLYPLCIELQHNTMEKEDIDYERD